MKRPVTIDDCCEFERLNGGDWHRGRGLVCWASNRTGGVKVKELSTGAVKVCTAGGGGEGCPRFSPDGKMSEQGTWKSPVNDPKILLKTKNHSLELLSAATNEQK